MKIEVTARVEVHHHYDSVPVTLLTRIESKLERIMATQAEIVAELKAAKEEIVTKIQSLNDQLAAAIANQTGVTPELQAAADDLKAFADGLAAPPT